MRVVQGGAETGESLVRAPGVAKVLFTGSGAVGRLVAATAGERLRPVTLELGGKDPMLVFEDADLDRAVAGALWGSFSNCGQVCSGLNEARPPPAKSRRNDRDVPPLFTFTRTSGPPIGASNSSSVIA